MYGPSTNIQLQVEQLLKKCKHNFTVTRNLPNIGPEVFYNAVCTGWLVNNETDGLQKQDFLLRSITEPSVWIADAQVKIQTEYLPNKAYSIMTTLSCILLLPWLFNNYDFLHFSGCILGHFQRESNLPPK